MSKRKTIKMREPAAMDVLLCRDKGGVLAVWFGDREDLKLYYGRWESINGVTAKWLDLMSNQADFRVEDFCKWFFVSERDLPKPGYTKLVTIELPRWEAEMYGKALQE